MVDLFLFWIRASKGGNISPTKIEVIRIAFESVNDKGQLQKLSVKQSIYLIIEKIIKYTLH